MLIVENKEHHWHLRVGTKGRGKVDAWMFESSDDEVVQEKVDIEVKMKDNNDEAFLFKQREIWRPMLIDSYIDPRLDDGVRVRQTFSSRFIEHLRRLHMAINAKGRREE
jgi:hypothetical protein